MSDPSNFGDAAHLGALVLAAGKGTRMHSGKPKVLHRMLEEPMLRYVFDAVFPLCPRTTWTVIGHGAESVRRCFDNLKESFILQEPQLGTGHALQVAMPAITASGVSHLLIVNGDTPLMPVEILKDFIDASLRMDADLAFITLTLDDPAAFGRVVRSNGEVRAIVEAKDYDPSSHGLDLKEINAGMYCLNMVSMAPLLELLSNRNNSGEFYLTQLIELAVERNMRVLGLEYPGHAFLLGVNTPAELVRSEEVLRAAILERHAANGVILRAASGIRIGPDVRIAPGVDITGPCEIYGATRIGPDCEIASHCRIEDADIGERAIIHSYSHILGAKVGDDCTAGPYARLRPGSVMEQGSHIGNFVEMKQSRLGRGAKANHLTYLGDADIGDGANIGAGTITCNYDGRKKHRTTIGQGAFVGSNSSLVAPVSIGEGAVIGAGSVITKQVPDKNLAVARGLQRNIPRDRKG